MPKPKSQSATADGGFTEADHWASVGAGWRQLAGDFRKRGFSFEWHDFVADEGFDWGVTFHPESLELCLNLKGDGEIRAGGITSPISDDTCAFYTRSSETIQATRAPRAQHQFITVEYSAGFLSTHLGEHAAQLHPLVQRASTGRARSGVSDARRLSAELRQLVVSLQHPPVLAAAQSLWYQCKALELATACLFQETQELFCSRQKRVAQDRVDAVVRILRRDLASPPPLEELGREVGCSHFYLSRTFSKEMGTTIPQYLRKLRMERAAELLRARSHNVTEAALEVGYSSLSHFSQAFHEAFGCCPGLYPMPMPRQAGAER